MTVRLVSCTENLQVLTRTVGFGNLITGDASPGVTAYTTTRCAVDLISTMHKTGARNFLFLNVSSRSAINAKYL